MNDDLKRRYRFFRENAGGMVGHLAMTAITLARAEARAKDLDLGILYENEELPWDGEGPAPGYWLWMAVYQRSDVDQYGDARRNAYPLASLGGIAVNSLQDPYLRVLRAELFAEAIAELNAAADRLATAQAVELSARATLAGPSPVLEVSHG